jgi:hypothetical protein
MGLRLRAIFAAPALLGGAVIGIALRAIAGALWKANIEFCRSGEGFATGCV